jgi:hypothetical protein
MQPTKLPPMEPFGVLHQDQLKWFSSICGPRTFCGRLIEQYAQHSDYFDPCHDWPHPIEFNVTIPLVLQQLAFLGDTKPPRVIGLCAG